MTHKVFVIGDALNYRMKRPDRYSTERFIKAFKEGFIPELKDYELEQIAENLVTSAKYVANHHENCDLWLELADELKQIIEQRKASKHG